MIATHTDVVGSLLHPSKVLKARADVVAGYLTQAAFKAIELQEEVGLEVVTGVEMRRSSFQTQMTESVDGFGEYDINAFLRGDWYGDKK